MSEWRKLHNKDFRDLLYSSPSVIRIIKLRIMRWVKHEARKGEKRNTYRLWRQSQRERSSRCRWVDNIRMNLG
jgi:hypothetical protein